MRPEGLGFPKRPGHTWDLVGQDGPGFVRMFRIRRSNIQIFGDLGKKVNFAVIGVGKTLDQVSESSGAEVGRSGR
jgi:hypothetical protein